MADAKASGPLYVTSNKHSGILPWTCSEHNRAAVSPHDDDVLVCFPCRILPGHGRWVPAELVAAIEREFDQLNKAIHASWLEDLAAAIRAAKEGEV